MSVEQAIHEVQEQLTASFCRPPSDASRTDYTPQSLSIRGRASGWWTQRTLMPDQFGRKNGPSRRTWSYLARDFVGVVHVTLKQAMKAEENQKQPNAVTHLQHEFNVTTRDGPRIATFLDLEDRRRSSRRLSEELNENQACSNSEDWLLCVTNQQLGGLAGQQQANLVSTEGRQNRRPLKHHPSL